jgi:thymidylate kinase
LYSHSVDIEWSAVWRSLKHRVAKRVHQIIRKQGIEVALIGIDGTGKSTMANHLKKKLPLPTQVLYMGNNKFLTSPMKWLEDKEEPCRSLVFLALHYEMFVRRVKGYLMSKRGHIVIYDRHPVERKRIEHRWKDRLQNLFAQFYNWKVDQNFFLHGDLEALYARKREYSVKQLRELFIEIKALIKKHDISVDCIDTVKKSKDSVYDEIGRSVIDEYNNRSFF